MSFCVSDISSSSSSSSSSSLVLVVTDVSDESLVAAVVVVVLSATAVLGSVAVNVVTGIGRRWVTMEEALPPCGNTVKALTDVAVNSKAMAGTIVMMKGVETFMVESFDAVGRVRNELVD